MAIGKAAIAAVLIRCEKLANLQRPVGDDPDDWISRVWSSLQKTGKDDFGENKLSIVSFNYDRSLEE